MIRLMTLLILVGIVLAHISGQTNLLSANWLWLAVLPAFMGLQATFTGWCPAELVGKLSKTGECCPGGSCSTKKVPEVPSQDSACCAGATDAQASEKPSEKQSSCCGSNENAKASGSIRTCCGSSHALQIKVLGTGCANCNNTVKLIQATADELGVTVEVIKVEEIAEIASYGVMSTPGVVIHEQVVHAGGIPSKKAVSTWLKA
jgi:small redox-active disulfide protein 2